MFCGVGLGLVVPRASAEVGPAAIAWRHAGLVLGLVLVTPLLTHDLTRTPPVTERAITADVLDARLPLPEKVALARSLGRTIGDARKMPDLAPVFAPLARTGADPAALGSVRVDIEESIRSTVTRAFRRSFLVCAALALLAALPLVRLRRVPLQFVRATVALGGAASVLVAAELAVGGWSYGAARSHDPCAQRTLHVGGGLDGFAQRAANDVLDGAACRLGTSREQLVLDAARTGSRWLSALHHL